MHIRHFPSFFFAIRMLAAHWLLLGCMIPHRYSVSTMSTIALCSSGD